MNKKENVCVCWFRRDLRLDDNAALLHALTSGYKVLPVFIFDMDILHKVEKPHNRQVVFIHSQIEQLKTQLENLNSSLLIAYTHPLDFFRSLSEQYNIKAVYANEDYELLAIERDKQIEALLHGKNIPFFSSKDQVIFSKSEVVKDDGKPYTVFTPYSRKWKSALTNQHLEAYPCQLHYGNLLQFTDNFRPLLSDLGFENQQTDFPSHCVNDQLIANYDQLRDYPSSDATTHLGVHLRFGTISIRKLTSKALLLNQTFLNELIWRDFYQSITYHFPHIGNGLAFKTNYDAIRWRNNESEFAAWCNGQTGYPIVDAGMRQLNATGFMHNRVRMICASFLVKHLLIDWRWGELYFQNQLLDFDFAANNGGWQWAASCGCDAVPYFRIFNPTLQAQKFDKQQKYINHWIPEMGTDGYPKPIVDHNLARNRAIEVYKTGLRET